MSDNEEVKHGRGFGVARLGTRKGGLPAGGPAALFGCDVEVRAIGSSVTRGRLVAAGNGWLTIENHIGKTVVVREDAVASIVCENGLRSEGQADVEHRVGTSAADGDE